MNDILLVNGKKMFLMYRDIGINVRSKFNVLLVVFY